MEKKILLVDDEAGIRKVLGVSLADGGYQVHTAENGEQALEIFRAEHPPIVLTDIRMPGMDGIELLRKIKRENPDTEVIMITGHGEMDLAIKSLKYDAVDFITKPVNDDILDIALKRAGDKILMREKLKAYTENLESLVQEKSARLIEIERQVAVGQAVEGLTSAMKNMASDLEGGIKYFNEMPCFVSIHSRDLRVVAANQLYTERLGERLGMDGSEIYTGRSDSHVVGPVQRTFKTGRGQRARAVLRYSDGKEVPVIVYTSPIRNRQGDVELVVEISAAISEIKQLQEELRSSQKQYQQLFDEVPCYISVQDRQLRLMGANRRFKEDFDHEVGSRCFEVYKHRSEPCPDCPVAKTFETGKSHQAEMVVTAKSGEQYNVLIWTAPIRNAAGEIIQVMEMSTNITQIRQLQDHLSSLGLKIGSMSHSIKGLLSGLDGGVYLIDTGFEKKDHERVREGWKAVKVVVERIRKLVVDILYFAKERDLNLEKIDVNGFARETAAAVESKIRLHNIEFIKNFDSAAGNCQIDAGVMRSALLNILENALDACVVDTSKNAHKIVFSVAPDGANIVFEVSDNGIGMERETRENLFTLFFSSKGGKGTGLGLFVANRVVKQHGGKISVDSTPGRGARFTIRLPKVPVD